MRIFLSNKINLQQIRFAAILIVTILGSLLGPATAGAVDDNAQTTKDPVVVYCKTKIGLKSAAQKACDDNKLIEQTSNAASYECKGESAVQNTSDPDAGGTDLTTCIDKQAKIYLKKAADSSAKAKKTKADFTKALQKVLKDTGNDLTKPAPIDPDSSLESQCNALTGTCADCNNLDASGNPPSGCVGCTNGVCHDPAADPRTSCTKNACNLVKKYINPLINLLSISFGLLAIISIILGGVQYASSEGDPQKVSQAKNRISKTILAIVAYFFMYALLQFLIPGGLFDTPTP